MGVNSTRNVLLENLRKQLGVAVRSVQWSYAIFWSLSTTQQGVLVWHEGYYNGDVKTRKTGPTEDANADRLGLRRSEQLRELYELLLEGGSVIEERSNKRPSASLSPEDLSDLEWYYLVCMSFVFKPGQGLPGRTLANGRPTWLCNAPDADSKVFSRSLLAKSASVQTVICVPHASGVIELGVTDVVSEDSYIIQQISTSILEFAKPICLEMSSGQQDNDHDGDHMRAKLTHLKQETVLQALRNSYPSSKNITFGEEITDKSHGTMSHEVDDDMASPDVCSNMFDGDNNHTEDSPMLYGNGDDHGQCINHDSVDSTGYISWAFKIQQEKPVCSSPKGRNINSRVHLQELEVLKNPTMFGTIDLESNDCEDLHYKQTVAVILQRRNFTVSGQSAVTWQLGSSFMPWNSEVGVERLCDDKSSQSALKKMLLTVPLMISGSPAVVAVNKKQKDACPSKKSRENEKYMALGSRIPSVNKTDKTPVEDNTTEYVKELETRVGKLESRVSLAEQDTRVRRKKMDSAEQTPDNYDPKGGKKLAVNKRKASDIDKKDGARDAQLGRSLPEDNNNMPLDLDVKVSIAGEEVRIEMRCCWREYLLVDILEVINNLTLDAHTVQSETLDEILTLSIQSKFRGAAFVSAEMIRQALRRTAGIC